MKTLLSLLADYQQKMPEKNIRYLCQISPGNFCFYSRRPVKMGGLYFHTPSVEHFLSDKKTGIPSKGYCQVLVFRHVFQSEEPALQSNLNKNIHTNPQNQVRRKIPALIRKRQ